MRVSNIWVLTLAVCCLLSGVCCFSAEKGLVGWWRFDEGSGEVAKDSSGNGNDGEITNCQWVAGKIGKALKFNGEDAFVEVSHSEVLVPDEFTIEAWINPAGLTPASTDPKILDRGPMILSKYGGNWKGYILLLEGGSGKPSIHIDTPENEIAAVAKEPVKVGTWYHIAGTYDGKKASIYVNGVLQNSAEAEITHDEGISLFIGKASWFDGGYFQGTIDEVKIYNRVLSADEIKAHAQ